MFGFMGMDFKKNKSQRGVAYAACRYYKITSRM